MGLVQPLQAAALYQRCDPMQFAFETSADLEDLTGVIGQARAVEAVRFGIGISRNGYNLFALGPEGTGKYSTVRRYLERQAIDQPPPADWCYVSNFLEAYKPRTLQLPAGGGVGSATAWSVSSKSCVPPSRQPLRAKIIAGGDRTSRRNSGSGRTRC